MGELRRSRKIRLDTTDDDDLLQALKVNGHTGESYRRISPGWDTDAGSTQMDRSTSNGELGVLSGVLRRYGILSRRRSAVAQLTDNNQP